MLSVKFALKYEIYCRYIKSEFGINCIKASWYSSFVYLTCIYVIIVKSSVG